MAFDRFLIGPYKEGLETDLKPFMIPDEAFAELNNAYVYRGRVKKRFGSTLSGYGAPNTAIAPLYSRVCILIGTTDGSGAISFAPAPGNPLPGNIFKIGQQFSIENVIFTAYQASGQMYRSDGKTSPAFNAAFDTVAKTVAITGAPINTPVYFYPAEPIMGIYQYEFEALDAVSHYHQSIIFDTQFAYRYSGGFWIRIDTGQWHSSYLDFFWATNYQGVTADKSLLFVSNYHVVNSNSNTVPWSATTLNTDDPLCYYDGATFTQFSPQFIYSATATANVISTAKIILPFKDRLLMLNTIETNNTGTTNNIFSNRCRFSHNGSALSTNAFWNPNVSATIGGINYVGDGGGWVDAPTEEAIVSAGFIKDRLIVYFENSTWEIVYTHNQILPFVWQKINTELGSQGTHSLVNFDKITLAIGTNGIHASDSIGVTRIDTKIPDDVFQIKQKNKSPTQLAGVRDYKTEMVYWSFPSSDQNTNNKYPNKVLVFNYKNQSWAFNDDAITAFGYFDQQTDRTWANLAGTTWAQANFSWNSGVMQSQAKRILAGNQQGFLFIIDSDISRNAPVISITNMAMNAGTLTITAVDHNIEPGDFIKIENCTNISGNFQVDAVSNSSTITIVTSTPFVGTYIGGATIAKVSQINILSKQWNPYLSQGMSFYLAKIEFNIDRTTKGKLTVDYYPSYSQLALINEASVTGTLLGTNKLDTFPYYSMEQVQDQLWHPVYFQTDGDSVQIRIHTSDEDMLIPEIVESGFELNAMVLHTQATRRRM